MVYFESKNLVRLHICLYENWFINDNKIKIKNNNEVNIFVKLYLNIK